MVITHGRPAPSLPATVHRLTALQTRPRATLWESEPDPIPIVGIQISPNVLRFLDVLFRPWLPRRDRFPRSERGGREILTICIREVIITSDRVGAGGKELTVPSVHLEASRSFCEGHLDQGQVSNNS